MQNRHTAANKNEYLVQRAHYGSICLSFAVLFSLSALLPLEAQQSNKNSRSTDPSRFSRLKPIQEQRTNQFRQKQQTKTLFQQSRYKKEAQRRQNQSRQNFNDARANPQQTTLDRIPSSELNNLNGELQKREGSITRRKRDLLKTFKSPDNLHNEGLNKHLSDQTSTLKNNTQNLKTRLERFKKEVKFDEARRVGFINDIKKLIQKNQIDPAQLSDMPSRENFHKLRQQGNVNQLSGSSFRQITRPEGLSTNRTDPTLSQRDPRTRFTNGIDTRKIIEQQKSLQNSSQIINRSRTELTNTVDRFKKRQELLKQRYLKSKRNNFRKPFNPRKLLNSGNQ